MYGLPDNGYAEDPSSADQMKRRKQLSMEERLRLALHPEELVPDPVQKVQDQLMRRLGEYGAGMNFNFPSRGY